MTLPLYLLAINAICFFLFWQDKRAARYGGWRVSESTLLTFVVLGGSPAAIIASHLLRHKNRKISFRLRMYLLILFQIVAIYYLKTNHYV